ncbi:DUF2065 domain-containing protein [Mesosutterella sp. OilRF-GAM-744-9]|uniref:DUF2065 domain-containing protein n=1 Tax=Mesosutterella porci TaxID=2915351 RepID=A0ABS9MT84_9BURK|nr:DUF2065 domain-containing protein [Mesosutterella sp. oilRF-744-WT-GAM-9]MCG5031827.1 DUF2065 domain-containing protein [Mesosutterella sp. oilRF-744-WT-GAM-9]MCI6529887.1 DUF2065 domain-containing protein [Mesosutterella sp.]
MGVNELFCALGFAVIFECFMPMVAPARWKSALERLLQVPESTLRWIGALGVASGLALVWLLQTGTLSLG